MGHAAAILDAAGAQARLRVHIRWMIRRDIPDIVAAEGTGAARPWGEEEFLGSLRRRNCIGMVAEHGERVVGSVV